MGRLKIWKKCHIQLILSFVIVKSKQFSELLYKKSEEKSQFLLFLTF